VQDDERRIEAEGRSKREHCEMEKAREAFYLLYSLERVISMRALVEMNGERCAQRQIGYLNRYEGPQRLTCVLL